MLDASTKHESFRVFIRCRPLNEREVLFGSRKRAVTLNEPTSSVTLSDSQGRDITMNFDYVFGEGASNKEVFARTIKPLTEHFANGYNSTVFAYGITGAGKSYTMFGDGGNRQGLIPLTFEYLLGTLPDSRLRMSYIEVYNEQVFDLLVEGSSNLQVLEDAERGVVVMDLEEREVQDIEEVKELIRQGNHRRVMAQTNANEFSSRSHAIVMITLERVVGEKVLTAKLSLVDLAGSEKGSVYDNNKAIRSLEGSNINKSLLALGNCIMMLSDGRKGAGFVPYRDSKLTRLLKDSLGGNTKTVMIGCISPSALTYDETINTLKYAGRARKIEKVVHQNVKPTNELGDLKQEVARLRMENALLKANGGQQPRDPQQVTGWIHSLIEVVKDSVHIQEMLSGGDQDDAVLDELQANQNEQNRLIKLIAGLSDVSAKTEPSEVQSDGFEDSLQSKPCIQPFSRKNTEDLLKENRAPVFPVLSELRSKMCRQNLQIFDCSDGQYMLESGLKSALPANTNHRRWKHMESLQEVRRINERLALMRENRQQDDFQQEADYI